MRSEVPCAADTEITEGELQRLIDGVQREALREAERAITWETGLPQVDSDAATPDATALLFGEESRTFADCHSSAGRLCG